VSSIGDINTRSVLNKLLRFILSWKYVALGLWVTVSHWKPFLQTKYTCSVVKKRQRDDKRPSWNVQPQVTQGLLCTTQVTLGSVHV
jgi:hypothetical protein